MTENWVQGIGTAIAIAGLVVVAPYEAGRALQDLWQPVKRLVRGVRPWLRRRLRGHGGAIVDSSSGVHLRAEVSLSATGVVGTGSTAEPRLLDLIKVIQKTLGELQKVLEESQSSNDRRFQLIENHMGQLDEAGARLREHVETVHRDQSELNARGFPLAAAGGLLAGVPFWFDERWWWLLLIAPLGLIATTTVYKSRDQIATGWKHHRAASTS